MQDQKTIGGFLVMGELGRGGMGVVYKARDPKDGTIVALKVLPMTITDPKTIKRFLREANALLRLQHPNVVRIIRAGSDQGLHYYAMEYVVGTALASKLRKVGRLDPREAGSVATMIGRALHYIHSHEMVHRDVKSANILIDPRGLAKLADFGLVRSADNTLLTGDGNVVGTPGYMSPEQVSGGNIDARSDLYSFAVVLYEMLTGTLPFVSTSAYKVMMAQRFERPDPPNKRCPDVNAEISKVILKAMDKEPRHRFASIADFCDELRKAGLPVENVREGETDVPAGAVVAAEAAAALRAKESPGAVRPLFFVLASLFIAGSVAGFSTLRARLHEPPASPPEAGTILSREMDRTFEQYRAAADDYVKGLEQYRKKQLPAAVELLRSAVRKREDHSPYLRALAVALTDSGRLDEARAAWQSYIRLERSTAEVAVAQKVLASLEPADGRR